MGLWGGNSRGALEGGEKVREICMFWWDCERRTYDINKEREGFREVLHSACVGFFLARRRELLKHLKKSQKFKHLLRCQRNKRYNENHFPRNFIKPQIGNTQTLS